MKRKFTDLDKTERIVLRSMLRNPKTDKELREWLGKLDAKEERGETDPFIFMVTFVIILFIIILISSLMP